MGKKTISCVTAIFADEFSDEPYAVLSSVLMCYDYKLKRPTNIITEQFSPYMKVPELSDEKSE